MRSITMILLLLLLAVPASAGTQSCSDFDPCTVNDMCVDEECVGTPSGNASCDDADPCTVNDRCTPDGCMGEAPTEEIECAGGCGVCTQIVPVPGVPFTCSPKPDVAGDPCTPFGELGPCVSGTCQVFGGLAVFCSATFKTCPDTDGNPCTDVCNFETGECTPQGSRCIPGCETCNPANGNCQPANLGTACDDFDPCTTASSCQSLEGRGFCLAGTPSAASPTATVPPTVTSTQAVSTATHTHTRVPTATPPVQTPTAAANTPTPAGPTATPPAGTPTAVLDTPTPGDSTTTPTEGSGATPTPDGLACVGDCNGNNVVAINELIIGVNIALGNAVVGQCSSFDRNGNGAVAINELISGVNNALNGCAA